MMRLSTEYALLMREVGDDVADYQGAHVTLRQRVKEVNLSEGHAVSGSDMHGNRSQFRRVRSQVVYEEDAGIRERNRGWWVWIHRLGAWKDAGGCEAR